MCLSLGSEAAVTFRRRDRGAGSLGHKFEGIALVIHRAGACAGGAGPRKAIVVTLECRAETGLDLAGLDLGCVTGPDLRLFGRGRSILGECRRYRERG